MEQDKFFNRRFICEICGGIHKTSQHSKIRRDPEGNILVCDVCAGPHSSFEHEAIEKLKKKQNRE